MAKPTEHVLGSVLSLDPSAQAMVVKSDATSESTRIDLSGARTMLKVPPGAKDLKSASRIAFSDLAVGDRVDVRGTKSSTADGVIAARSVVLMSGADLKQRHEAEQAEWKASTPGTVTAVDMASNSFVMRTRGEQGLPAITVTGGNDVRYTRFSPDTPNTPAPSDLSQLQPGDQVRVIGTQGSDPAHLQATKVYSGTFRTITGRVTSIGANGSSLAIEQVQPQQPITVTLNQSSVIRRLPPEMAAALARRASGASATNPSGGGMGHAPNGASGGSKDSTGNEGAHRQGDVSRMLERVPAIAVSDLKVGDTLIVSGTPQGSAIVATTVLAGAEALLQTAPARQRGRQAQANDWSLDMNLPAQ